MPNAILVENTLFEATKRLVHEGPSFLPPTEKWVLGPILGVQNPEGGVDSPPPGKSRIFDGTLEQFAAAIGYTLVTAR